MKAVLLGRQYLEKRTFKIFSYSPGHPDTLGGCPGCEKLIR